MARSIRIEYEGAWYHVMARGNRRDPIFQTEKDCEMMLETLGEACGKSGWEVHAWVLMGNHFHFVIHTPQANLVEGMRWFMNTYTRRHNSRNRLWGRVFGDRYKALLIEAPEHSGEGDYLRSLLWYVHLNPVRAGLVRRDENGCWKWSDYRWNSLVWEYGVSARRRHEWARIRTGLDLEHLSDTPAGRRAYSRLAEQKAAEWLRNKRRKKGREEMKHQRETVRQGWYAGGETFRDWLLEKVEAAGGGKWNENYRNSRQGHDHGIWRAERLIERGLEHFGLKRGELKELKGGDGRRLAIADGIWGQTNVSQGWIAAELGMRSAGNVSELLRRYRLGKTGCLSRKERKAWEKKLKLSD